MGRPSTRVVLNHRHLVPVLHVPADRLPDAPAQQRRHPVHQRKVLLHERALRELLAQAPMRGVRLGDHDRPGGFPIEPVHDTRPLHPTDPAQRAATVRQQCVHQGRFIRAGTGMDHHAGRLVHHQ